jgi:hypothetical protein
VDIHNVAAIGCFVIIIIIVSERYGTSTTPAAGPHDAGTAAKEAPVHPGGGP